MPYTPAHLHAGITLSKTTSRKLQQLVLIIIFVSVSLDFFLLKPHFLPQKTAKGGQHNKTIITGL
jgi:hypothetical protein